MEVYSYNWICHHGANERLQSQMQNTNEAIVLTFTSAPILVALDKGIPPSGGRRCKPLLFSSESQLEIHKWTDGKVEEMFFGKDNTTGLMMISLGLLG